MLFQHSIDGYSKIPTITQKTKQTEFNQLENLWWQVKPPNVDEYFNVDSPKDFSKSREDYCETREKAYQIVSKRPFSFWNKCKLKYCPIVYPIKYNKGLLRCGFWFYRYYLYNANNEEFFAYHLHPEDINFETNFYKEHRIKLTIIYNNIQYITINAFDFLTIGDLLNDFLKYPIWSNFYSFTVSDNLHKFDLVDFMFKIKYFVDHNILHDGSIILIKKLPDKKFLLF